MRFVLIVLSIVLAIPAHGSPVSVRADDHAEFTRIILTFEVRPDWSAAPRTATAVPAETAPAATEAATVSPATSAITSGRLSVNRGQQSQNEAEDCCRRCEFHEDPRRVRFLRLGRLKPSV